MIKSNFGEVTIEGSVVMALADFTVIIESLYKALKDVKGDEWAREQIADAGRRAFEHIDYPESVSEKSISDLAKLVSELLHSEEEEIEK